MNQFLLKSIHECLQLHFFRSHHLRTPIARPKGKIEVSHYNNSQVAVSHFFLPRYCFRLELWPPSSEAPRTLVMIRILFRSSLDFFLPLVRMPLKPVVDGVGDRRFLPTDDDAVDDRRLPPPPPPRLRRSSSLTLNLTENIVAHAHSLYGFEEVGLNSGENFITKTNIQSINEVGTVLLTLFRLAKYLLTYIHKRE